MAKKPGTFKEGEDGRRAKGQPGRGGRISGAERKFMLKLLKSSKTEAAIQEVLGNPKDFGDIWLDTAKWVAARANGPIPTVTATIASPGMAGGESGEDPGDGIPGAPGLAAWPTIALMQQLPAPVPPTE